MSIPAISDYAMPQPGQWPASRVQWPLEARRCALLIHDMQRYFLRFYQPGGALLPALLRNLAALRQWADAHGVPVLYTAQPHQQAAQDRALLNDMWGPGLPAAAPEQAEIVPELLPRPQDVVLTKWRYSAFARSDLAQRMQGWGRDQLLIGGVYAHIGCMVTAVDAFMHDIQPFFVADALADFSRDEHDMALRYVASRCGVVIGTQAVTRTTTSKQTPP